ncbi:MAG: relaxase, partial [Faecalibacterium prausnitzii]
MATIKHLTSKNSNYAAAESYLTFQHNEYTGLPILDEKGRPKLRDSYLLDTLECGESSFAMACLIANRKYGKNGRREDVKTYHIWRHPPKRMLIYSCAARTAGHTKYIISFDPKDAVENGLTMERAQALGLQFCKDNFPGHP